ncbi:MAG: glycosyltransferase [Rhodocyclales bacterium]|nr:glycosyltransferase [Rhodocyclales bacterium]
MDRPDLRIRFFGTYHRERVARISVLLDGLREIGCMCEEMNARLPVGHDQRLAMLRSPWLACRLPFALLQAWLRLVAQRIGARPADIVLVPYMGHFDVVLARALHPYSHIVLDHLISAADTANDRRAPYWLQRILSWLDGIAVTCADTIMVDTEEQATLVPLRFRDKTIVVPVGAPRSWYAGAPPTPSSGPLSIVFFGLFTPLQGTITIADALNILEERGISYRATLIGRGQDFSAVRERLQNNSHICWFEWLDDQSLFQQVGSHDVCLGIFGTSAKAARVVPQKLYLGAAAGCALVTSDTPPQRRAFGPNASYASAGDANGLANRLATLAAHPDMLQNLRLRAREHARSTYQPDRIAATLASQIQQRRAR